MGISSRVAASGYGPRMALAAAFHLPLVAYAAPSDDVPAFQPYVGYMPTYEDNVLGLPSDDIAEVVIGTRNRSDRSRTTQAGLLFDTTLSQQHVSGKIGFNDTKYDKFTQLNNQGQDISLLWNWRLGAHLDGEVSASHLRSLTPFVDFHELARNVRTQRQKALTARWHFHSSWRIDGAVGRSATDYGLLSQQANDRRYQYGEVGVDYLGPSGSTFGVVARRGRGEYRSQFMLGGSAVSNDFTQDELKARVDWAVTGKGRLQFFGGAVARTHETLGYRDYRGLNARLTSDWSLTGKLNVTAVVWREIAATDDITTLYALTKGTSLSARLLVSAKTSTDVMLRRDNRVRRRAAEFAQVPEFQDSIRSAAWNVNYSPLRSLTLRATAYYEVKAANTFSQGFTRRGLSATTEYRF